MSSLSLSLSLSLSSHSETCTLALSLLQRDSWASLSYLPSPAVERGTKRDPIMLSPAGKFQRTMDTATNI